MNIHEFCPRQSASPGVAAPWVCKELRSVVMRQAPWMSQTISGAALHDSRHCLGIESTETLMAKAWNLAIYIHLSNYLSLKRFIVLFKYLEKSFFFFG